MGVLDSMENAIAHISGSAGTVDVAKVEAIIEALLAAAPAIEQGIVSTAPYIEAIVTMIKTGGNPSEADWATLNSSLDSGSKTLDDAATAAQAELNLTAQASPEGAAPSPSAQE